MSLALCPTKPNEKTNFMSIDPESLLPLVPFRRMSTDYGYLLRHYWMPSGELRYLLHRSERNGAAERHENGFRIKRSMKFDADLFVWREKYVGDNDVEMIRYAPCTENESLCEYDRSKQHLRMRSPLDHANTTENRNEAYWALPILPPLLPIPLGFRWHVRHGDDTLDFMLESSIFVHDMEVLFIRRHGRFTLPGYFRDNRFIEQNIVVHREGISAYALDRSVVLEDRIRDRIDSGAERIELETAVKLIQSSAD